ncbi:MAG: aldehyde dehydrogenase family protein [Phycisphaerae bacterium]|nr:aldehyde dehydrogenase family protein [Phycisphaerae bacterium]
MSDRLEVLKTYKLFIDGKFPRSESGRSMIVHDRAGKVLAHASRASRKDLREAVEAARRAQPGWAGATAYNRGQVLYRLAEMIEGKAAELAALIDACEGGKQGPGPECGAGEVRACVDRLVAYAGWADKYSQVLGCNNPVAGPYYNFTVPEPTGVVCVLAPASPSLLGLIALAAPALCAGNAVVAVASSASPLPAAVLAEGVATCDLPGGVLNILTTQQDELTQHAASHRDIDAIHAAGLDAKNAELVRGGVAENLKRVTVRTLDPADWYDPRLCENPWWIEGFVEMKTMWHPASV